MPPITPRPALRAHEVVLDRVEWQILDGSLGVGDLLPAERELSSRLDVSRAAVREAVRAVQAQGVVTSQVGASASGGTRISALPKSVLARFLRLHVALANLPVDDVLEVRVALERLSVREAVEQTRDADLRALRAAVEVMEQPDVDEERFNDADTAFHVALADVSANRLASDLTIAIRESMRQPILSALRSQQVWQEVADQQRAEHRAILTAVEERDADRAERLVEEHIRTAWARLRQPS